MKKTVPNRPQGRGWQFVTNHTQVLLCIARDPDVRLRDIAETVGITLGSAQRILADLIEAGFVQRERHGRRNRYSVNHDSPLLRHAAQDGQEIGGLLDLHRRQDGAESPRDAA